MSYGLNFTPIEKKELCVCGCDRERQRREVVKMSENGAV